MAHPASSFQQDWCRIGVFLPVGRPDELRAAEAVIAYLKRTYEGFTHSALRPANFDGFWWDAKRAGWVHDKVAMLIVDVPVSIQTSTLDQQIQNLQLRIFREYDQKHCPQKEVWVSCHQILMKRAKRPRVPP